MIKHETTRSRRKHGPDLTEPRALKAAMEYQWERRGLCCAVRKARWSQTDEDGRVISAGYKLEKPKDLK
jgi:hypothetical protein